MTEEQFYRATGIPQARSKVWYSPVENAMMEFAIVSPERAAMFLANVGHESGSFNWVREIWGPTEAQRRYDTRADLGNTRSEALRAASAHGTTPGPFYKGHGLIQITGYDNHLACGIALGLDLVNNPQLLEDPRNASRSAAWFWKIHGCNEIADTGDFDKVCDVINLGHKTLRIGDSNGFDDRLLRYKLAKTVL